MLSIDVLERVGSKRNISSMEENDVFQDQVPNRNGKDRSNDVAILRSEHVNARISTGLNHLFPYLNSRDSVDKFVSRHVSYNMFRKRKFTYFN